MDWAASMTPASTSLREVSTIRATKGAEATTRGRMAPRRPSRVPMTSLVKGNRATIKMAKGKERPMLMIHPSTALTGPLGRMPWGWVSTETTPMGRPMR
jgi:hypothetical protein